MGFRSVMRRGAVFFAMATLGLLPMWWRHALAPSSFSATYPVGFVVFFPAVTTILLWGAGGFYGWRDLFNKRGRAVWVMSAASIAVWGLLSILWAFMRETRPEVAMGAALQLAVAIMFAIAMNALHIPVRRVLWLLAGVMLVHAVIGGLQVIAQQDIGLGFIGEFTLNPDEGGTSVVQSGAVRWLRPYGLMPHPNIYAGFLVVGLCATAGLLFTERGWHLWVAAAIFVAMFWMLFMTFSRAAWLGFIIAGGLFVVLMGRQIVSDAGRRRRLFALAGVAICMGIAFLMLFRPLIFARAGVGAEATEVRSISDRVVYNDIALEAIRAFPVRGVGAGNFPWYASHYLFYVVRSEYKGDNVHNIYLTVQSELGAVGSVLFVVGLSRAIAGALRGKRSFERVALLCGVVALLTIGFFDHYPVTIFHHQMLFWAIMGWVVTGTGDSD